MKKIILLFIIIFLISCSKVDERIKKCLDSIISEPSRINSIFEEIQVSMLLKESIENYSDIYISCFSKFDRKYSIKEVLYSTNEEEKDIIGIMVYIINLKNDTGVQFQFRKYKVNNRLVLHNIILSGCLHAY